MVEEGKRRLIVNRRVRALMVGKGERDEARNDIVGEKEPQWTGDDCGSKVDEIIKLRMTS